MAFLEITLQIDPKDRATTSPVTCSTGDVVRELGPLLRADPDIRVFDVA